MNRFMPFIDAAAKPLRVVPLRRQAASESLRHDLTLRCLNTSGVDNANTTRADIAG